MRRQLTYYGVLTLLVAAGSTAYAQETVGMWIDDEWIVSEVAPHIWVMPIDRAGAEAALAAAGLSEFAWHHDTNCGFTAMLFAQPDATGTPILEAVDRLGRLMDNNFYWTFDAYTTHLPYFYMALEAGTTLPEAQALLSALGIGQVLEAYPHPDGRAWFSAYSSSRSGLEVIQQLNQLHEHPEVEDVIPWMNGGCPSGGGGGGIGWPPAPIGPTGAEIPTLSTWALFAFAAAIAAVGWHRKSSRAFRT